MRKRIVCVATLAGLCTFVRSSDAGIVNIASILATKAEPGVSGALTGSADFRRGNTDLLVLSAAPIARYRRGDHLVVAIIRGDLGTSNGERIILKTFEHVRYRYDLSERWVGELFGQHEFDQFRRLNLRTLLGIGPKFMVFDKKKFRMDMGVAYMFEHERLRDGMESDAGNKDFAHRASSYITARLAPNDRFELVETFYIQPRLDDARDVRLLNTTQIAVQATKNLKFGTALTVAHDARPPDDIEKTDVTLKSTFALSF